MSWAEVKKINSDMSLPLDKLIRLMLIGGYAWSIETGTHTLQLPEGLTKIYITASAAGGGGGGGAVCQGYGWSATGGGGGGRAEKVVNIEKNISASLISFTLGAAGTGGAGTGNSMVAPKDASAGTNGGSLIVDGLLTLAGGTAGTGAHGGYDSSHSWGGSGGTIGGGAGGKSSVNSSTTVYGGAGGSSSDIGTYGNGGAGGGAVYSTSGSNSTSNGANGRPGIIIITWGAISFNDVWSDIQFKISQGITHGEG